MRTLVSLAVILTSACVSAGVGRTTEANDLVISLKQGVVDQRPVILVTIMSTAKRPICIRSEILRNPYAQEMELWLRDGEGHKLAFRDPGFIPPPLEGVVRLEPGQSENGHYFVRGRFKLPNGGMSIPRGATARVAFRYGYCDDSIAFRAKTPWQRI